MGIPFSGSLRRKFPRAKRKRNQQLFNLTPGSEFLSFVGYLNLSFDRFKAVTNNEKSTQRNENHRNSLSPTKRTGRIAEDIPENHVGNADRKKKNNGCSSAEKEIEESAS